MKTRLILLGSVTAITFPLAASALSVTNTDDASALAQATLAASSGITIEVGSESLIGGPTQQGTYQDFTFPANNGQPALSLNDGVVLTSGLGDFSTTENTDPEASANPDTGSYTPLVDLADANGLNTDQNDSNVLSFDFTLDDPAQNAVKASFLFATDEFPTQSVTDILGIFVNGVNFAFFPNGDLVANQSGDPNDFFNDNSFGSGTYGIEWNGLTDVFSLTALALGSGQTNTIDIAIADTSDQIFDSAVFFTSLASASTTGGGGIDDPSTIPLPAAGWLLLGAIGGLMGMRRKKT